MKKTITTILLASFLMITGLLNAQVFTETMGSATATTLISAYETADNFDNDNFTMSGTGDVRITSPCALAGSSGGANVFLTFGSKTFEIAGINTTSLTNLALAFNVNKSTIAATSSNLRVEYSTDGTTYTALTWNSDLPTGNGTGIWHSRSVSGIPSAANVRLRFTNTFANGNQYRLDDLVLTGSVLCTPPTVSISSSVPNATLCASGGNAATALTANLSGGNGSWNYQWKYWNGSSFTSINGGTNATQNASPTNTLDYQIVVTSTTNAQCTASATQTVTVIADPVLSLTSTNVVCYGDNNGSAEATLSGGTVGNSYTLNWSPGTPAGDGTLNVSGLTPGTYALTANGLYGCNASGSVTILEPTVLTSSSTSGSIECNGGTTTVSVTAAGGTAPYSGDGNYTVGAGTYAYTITDANGCTSTTSITVSEPTALTSASTSGTITCNGGTTAVSVSATGGTAPYSGDGNYTVGVGTYSYTVTDANGCTSTTSITVIEPTVLTATITSTAPNTTVCSGGTAPLTASVGGTGTVNYQWQYQDNTGNWVNVSGWSATNVSLPFTNSRNASPSATRSYRIVIRRTNDANCVVIGTQVVTVIADPVFTITSTNISCFGANNGTATAILSGGLPLNYGYNWFSNDGISTNNNPIGDGTLSVTGLFPAQWVINTTLSGSSFGCYAEASVNITQPALLVASSTSGSITCNGGTTTVTVSATGGTAPYSGTGTFTVSAGNYSYTVTDANGCTSTTTITVSEPTVLTSASTSGAIACNGGTTTVAVSANGGTAPYSGAGNYTVGAGTYSYTVTDANGCTSTTTITVSEPTVLTSASTSGSIACNGGTTTVTVSANGGTAPYSGTGTFTVAAGNYSYTVTDANGCTSTTTGSVSQPTAVQTTVGAGQTVFYGYAPMACATISGSATGGTPGYSYNWSSNGTTNGTTTSLTVCPTQNTTYTLTATDVLGCTSSSDVYICVVDVRCYAGNSNKQKVQMCQTPPGNPANAHTICVDASAVPAHLAIGCVLGACGELASACSTNRSFTPIIEENVSAALTVYPNPTMDRTSVSLTVTNAGEYKVVLYNTMGQVVNNIYNGSMAEYENQTFDLNMSSIEFGVYILSVSNGDGTIETVRVVKQ